MKSRMDTNPKFAGKTIALHNFIDRPEQDDKAGSDQDIPEKYVKGLTFHYVKDVNEVFDFALLDEKVKGAIDLNKIDNDSKEEKKD